ncbi:hypothetical protein IQ255_15010 [Pleurocapsales cyanobacterium LEGE 10410]|nr:hypothetical protein [Pleurocapsales cyanobacterium LEGE 10410]
MSTQRLTQLLHPDHEHLNQFNLVVLVVVSSLLMGLVPFIYGLSSTDARGNNLIIPTEAELWKPVTQAVD